MAAAEAMAANGGLARKLLDYEHNDAGANAGYIVACILLVVFGGLMSGLTLGLLSLGEAGRQAQRAVVVLVACGWGPGQACMGWWR